MSHRKTWDAMAECVRVFSCDFGVGVGGLGGVGSVCWVVLVWRGRFVVSGGVGGRVGSGFRWAFGGRVRGAGTGLWSAGAAGVQQLGGGGPPVEWAQGPSAG